MVGGEVERGEGLKYRKNYHSIDGREGWELRENEG